MDLRLVDVARRRRVAEEQGQRQALVDMLGRRRIGVDDLLRPDLVGILIVIEIIVGHERRRIIDAADLAFLADLDLRDDRMDRGGRVVDIGDRACRRHCLQVLVIEAGGHHQFLQRRPVFLRRNVDVRGLEQRLHLLRRRLPEPVGIFVEIFAGGIFRVLEALEACAPFDRQQVRGADRVIGHRIEIEPPLNSILCE